MAKQKKLTIENLRALGAEVLARTLLDEAAHNKLLRRELTVLLKSVDGPLAVANEVRKRISALACSGSFIDRYQIQELARDLDQQRSFIADKIAPAHGDVGAS